MGSAMMVLLSRESGWVNRGVAALSWRMERPAPGSFGSAAALVAEPLAALFALPEFLGVDLLRRRAELPRPVHCDVGRGAEV